MPISPDHPELELGHLIPTSISEGEEDERAPTQIYSFADPEQSDTDDESATPSISDNLNLAAQPPAEINANEQEPESYNNRRESHRTNEGNPPRASMISRFMNEDSLAARAFILINAYRVQSTIAEPDLETSLGPSVEDQPPPMLDLASRESRSIVSPQIRSLNEHASEARFSVLPTMPIMETPSLFDAPTDLDTGLDIDLDINLELSDSDDDTSTYQTPITSPIPPDDDADQIQSTHGNSNPRLFIEAESSSNYQTPCGSPVPLEDSTTQARC